MSSTLKKYYLEKVRPVLKEKFSYQNIHEVPTITKVVINRGLGAAGGNSKSVENSSDEIAIICGQRPILNSSKKAIAGFSIREGMPVGMSVTLRGSKMYDFLERLINLALPRIRDFQGISSSSFDKRGNYSIGLNEQLMFPEIEFDKIDAVRGMDITIVTTAKTDKEALVLLRELGMPFEKK